MTDWISVSEKLPPRGEVVETKIDDGTGVRNVQPLKRSTGNGNLWFLADDSMYVYYAPTHWRPLTDDAKAEMKQKAIDAARAALARAEAMP